MIKYTFMLFSLLFVVAIKAEPLAFTYDNNKQQMNFYINNAIFDIELKNPFYQSRVDGCILEAYTLYSQDSTFGRIGIENINLNPSCTWVGLPQDLYEDFIKKELHLETLNVLQKVKIKNYELVTYSINDEYVINMVYLHSLNQSTFILDYKGVLFDTLLKKLKPNFDNKYSHHPRYDSVLNKSIVKNNVRSHYFKKQD